MITDRPRISCSTASMYHLPLPMVLRIIQDAGYDGAELVVTPIMLLQQRGITQRNVLRVGLPILSIHPPLLRFPRWPRSQLGGMVYVVAAARDFGAELVVIHAPKSYSLTTPRAQQYIAAIDIVRELAASNNITIGLETTQKPIDHPPRLFDDMTAFLEFTDAHALGVTFDTCHAAANQDDIVAMVERIGQRLGNVHFSDCTKVGDARPHTHRFPGSGNTSDLMAGVAALQRSQYRGMITLEISPTELLLLSPRQLVKQLSAAREYVVQALADGQV